VYFPFGSLPVGLVAATYRTELYLYELHYYQRQFVGPILEGALKPAGAKTAQLVL
jgi:hypothetical protein